MRSLHCSLSWAVFAASSSRVKKRSPRWQVLIGRSKCLFFSTSQNVLVSCWQLKGEPAILQWNPCWVSGREADKGTAGDGILKRTRTCTMYMIGCITGCSWKWWLTTGEAGQKLLVAYAQEEQQAVRGGYITPCVRKWGEKPSKSHEKGTIPQCTM